MADLAGAGLDPSRCAHAPRRCGPARPSRSILGLPPRAAGAVVQARNRRAIIRTGVAPSALHRRRAVATATLREPGSPATPSVYAGRGWFVKGWLGL